MSSMSISQGCAKKSIKVSPRRSFAPFAVSASCYASPVERTLPSRTPTDERIPAQHSMASHLVVLDLDRTDLPGVRLLCVFDLSVQLHDRNSHATEQRADARGERGMERAGTFGV